MPIPPPHPHTSYCKTVQAKEYIHVLCFEYANCGEFFSTTLLLFGGRAVSISNNWRDNDKGLPL